MSIVMMINLKGGVAKTTNAVAISECLAEQGYRTLLIDADHQCMAGELLLGEDRMLRCDRNKRTLHDLMAAMLDEEFSASQLDSFVIRTASNTGGGIPNLSAIPCSMRIDDFNVNMAKARRGHHSNDEFLELLRKRGQQLQKWLRKNFDFTIIDCPPSVAVQVRFLMRVADQFIVPSIPDRLSVRGCQYLMTRIKNLGMKIEPLGTLWSLYREQNSVHKRIVKYAKERSNGYHQLPEPFETIIPNATGIADANEQDNNPASFRKKYEAKFAKLFEALTGEIVKRTNWKATESDGARTSHHART